MEAAEATTNIQQLLPFRCLSGSLLVLVATAQLEGVLVALLVVVGAVLVKQLVRGLGARQLGGWWVLLLRPFFGGGEGLRYSLRLRYWFGCWVFWRLACLWGKFINLSGAKYSMSN
jgi:hypothetical protein